MASPQNSMIFPTKFPFFILGSFKIKRDKSWGKFEENYLNLRGFEKLFYLFKILLIFIIISLISYFIVLSFDGDVVIVFIVSSITTWMIFTPLILNVLIQIIFNDYETNFFVFSFIITILIGRYLLLNGYLFQ